MKNLTPTRDIRFWLTGVLLLGLVLGLGSCGKDDAAKTANQQSQASKADITFAYDGWSGSYLPMYVLKHVIEEELGKTVAIVDATTVPGAFEWVSAGQADIYVSGWFPIRDATFAKFPNLVKLGHIYGGKAKDAYDGWMVTNEIARQYGLTHVNDLRNKQVAQALDTDGDGKGNLIGSPKDWGAAPRLPEILSDYGLSGLYEIDEQESEKQMINTIEKHLKDGKQLLFWMIQPVAFPGDIVITDRAVWLEGTEPYLPLSFNRAIARNDIVVNHPDVARLLNRCSIPGTDISQAMSQIARKGESAKFISGLASDWIEKHQPQVDAWAAGLRDSSPPPVSDATLPVAYSPEKEDLFLKLCIAFNLSRSEETLSVHPIRRGMDAMLQNALSEQFAAISPDSSIWLTQLDRMWQQRAPEATSLIGHSDRYALSPIVIAMWQQQAEAMGYPEKQLGWEDLMERAAQDPGFKWSHPSAATASGLLATTAEFYAAAGKQANLTQEDVTAEANIEYVKNIEATVERYGGESEDKIVIRMLAEGGHPLAAIVAQEQLVIYFNRNTPYDDKLAAIYPREGTFWMDHPLVLLDGDWVTEAQQQTLRTFTEFLKAEEQQHLVLREGYRPANLSISLEAEGSLIQPEYNVDPEEPNTLLKVPSAGVVAKIRDLWRLTKKPANIYLVVDVSGSMEGEKLSAAKGALLSFIDQIEGQRDHVGIIAFSNNLYDVRPLGPLDKEAYSASIRGLEAAGKTYLFEAIAHAFDQLQQHGEADRINVIVAMTDGIHNGAMTLEALESKIRDSEMPVLMFTVGYGDDAEMDVLQRIAQLGEGQSYTSDPETIAQLYELVSKFF
jgi:Ca-activated chloride channel homolog